MPTDEKQEALSRFERELADAEREAKQVNRRVHNLRRVVAGLKGLLEPDDDDAELSLFAVQRRAVASAIREEPEAVVEGPIEPGDNGRPLRGRDAVRQVLIDTRRQWKIPALALEVERRGYMPGVKSYRDAVAATVQRLVKDGEAERVGHGVYRYRLDKLPPPEGGEP